MKPDTTIVSDTFLKGYLICAFWTDEDKIPEDCTIHNLPAETLADATEDCRIFQERNADTLSRAYEGDYNAEQAGHDFWLTRNGHGTGFWDREALEPQGEEWESTQIPLDQWTPEIRALRDRLQKESLGQLLTKAAKNFGEKSLYTGDDGNVYFS